MAKFKKGLNEYKEKFLIYQKGNCIAIFYAITTNGDVYREIKIKNNFSDLEIQNVKSEFKYYTNILVKLKQEGWENVKGRYEKRIEEPFKYVFDVKIGKKIYYHCFIKEFMSSGFFAKYILSSCSFEKYFILYYKIHRGIDQVYMYML